MWLDLQGRLQGLKGLRIENSTLILACEVVLSISDFAAGFTIHSHNNVRSIALP